MAGSPRLVEDVNADIDDYAKALHDERSNESATAMAAATRALEMILDSVDRTGRIELEALLAGHERLMRRDSGEQSYAGRLRDVQNWIGGSKYSPRNAFYVPPPPETVTEYMDDLLAFVHRDDLPELAQAFIAHAQFESIHPFTDGNGRIGRALINMVLRRRGLTTRIALPLPRPSLLSARSTSGR